MAKKVLDFDYISGDPFVEAGRRVVVERTGKRRVEVEEIRKLIDWALSYYVDKWNGKLNPISLNGPITQPAFKGNNRKIEETIKYFDRIYNQIGYEEGNCQVCGRLDNLFPADRSNMPLTGSNTNPNFHSYFSKGIMLCAECLTSLFFLPFAVINAGKCLLVINTLSDDIFKYWMEETLYKTVHALNSEGMAESRKKILSNQLYYLADRFSALDENIIRKESINLYYFTNFGASPECTFITLPKSVILFLKGIKEEKRNISGDFAAIVFSNMMRKDSTVLEEWNSIIWKNYRKNNAIFDQQKNEYLIKERKNLVTVSREEVSQWYNPIIEKLINNENILSYLRQAKVSSTLAVYYCLEVLKMDKDRIKVLIQLADKIAGLIEAQDKSDILIDLQKSRNPWEFRLALFKAMRLYAKTGKEEPLFNTEEYLYKIFPDGEPWTDARDLILVRLYEKLHKWLSNKNIDSDIQTEQIEN